MIAWMKDAVLEMRIHLELRRLLGERNRVKQRHHAKVMADLVKQRSPARVVKMERKAGIR